MYTPEFFPYDRPAREMTPGAMKKAFALVMEQKARRITDIANYLFENLGVLVSPSLDDDILDQIPSLISELGGRRELSEIEFESALTTARPQSKEAMRAVLSRQRLDGETLGMVFDAGLLWGEVFRFRYPAGTWAIGEKPKSSINYGNPVIIGVDSTRFEFCPQRELGYQVAILLSGKSSHWTLSKLMKVRANQLGLGPDPLVDD